MEVRLDLINEFRNEVLWLYAALQVEQTTAVVLSGYMSQGKTLDDANKFLANILNDREKLHGFFDEREFLIGATESEWDLMLDDYIPTLLKSQIESMEYLSSLQQEDNDETLETIIGRRRKIGFAPK